MSISRYEVLGAGRGQFGILEGVSFAYLTLCSPRSGPRAIWNFGGSFYIMFISLYVVLRAGRGQFGNLEGVSIAYFTLCSTQSGLCSIWEFGLSF